MDRTFARTVVGALAVAFVLTTARTALPQALPRLVVSENRRFLVTDAGRPFFWLGDTAWELFHRLDRDEAERYLRNRAERRFTVIQAVILAELDGLGTPNAYGHRPLVNNDPTRPDEAYFAHVDRVIARANSFGMYVGLLPTWGDKWNRKWGVGPEVFTPDNARAFGLWLGHRYRDAGVIWIVGGDRPIESDTHRAIVEAMAAGLREGDGGRHPITFHPNGGHGSAEWFHEAGWLDLNMRQNGHGVEFTGRYDATRADYDRMPVKPVLDGEPAYEDHPVGFDAKQSGHTIASDIRRPLYWNLFSGAFGHTYGHHSVWQMWTPERTPVNAPLMPWTEAIEQPGAAQMQHGRALMESRPFLTRVPDPTVLVASSIRTVMPGAGRYHFAATRDEAGTYAMVYAPVGRPFRVRMAAITGGQVKAWWFDPRNGMATAIGTFPNTGERTFTPPDAGEMLDWVLVLDDAAKGYLPPGTVREPGPLNGPG